jgi:hypothetical protein
LAFSGLDSLMLVDTYPADGQVVIEPLLWAGGFGTPAIKQAVFGTSADGQVVIEPLLLGRRIGTPANKQAVIGTSADGQVVIEPLLMGSRFETPANKQASGKARARLGQGSGMDRNPC